MVKKQCVFLILFVLAALAPFSAHAKPSYPAEFAARYPNSPLNSMSCALCHPNYNTSQWNAFGNDFKSVTSYSSISDRFAQIESHDPDHDGATNLAEINAG